MKILPGTGEPFLKPPIKEFIPSPNISSRNGGIIRYVVLHYTAGGTVRGAISHFKNPDSQVSAHYIIDKNGDIYQMVRDSDKAWHARKANNESIGIEHVAKDGERLTAQQEMASIQLIRWLLAEYKIPKSGVVGHKYVGGSDTNCPHSLFGPNQSRDELQAWVDLNFV